MFRSRKEAAEVLAERTGLAPHVIETRIRSGAPLPSAARRQSKHPEAGSIQFRRWLALLRRHSHDVEPAWVNDYDRFKSDVLPTFRSGLQLIRKDSSKPWGPENFEWVSVQQKVERTHGAKVRLYGVEYPSLKAVAELFGVGLSTLKDRIGRQGMTPEEAVAKPLGVTSCRRSEAGQTVVDGKVFRSKRQAILHIAETRGITEHQAKYRFSRGDFD
jgi:hypothetical protein